MIRPELYKAKVTDSAGPTLLSLAVNYSCDKYYSHSYIPIYSQMFGPCRTDVQKLLEIGVGYEELMTPFVPRYVHGASLLMWRDFFPNADVYGCDIRSEAMFHEPGIVTLVCDQSKPVELLELVGMIGGNLDIIIDDGSHQKEHQILTARTLLPYMSVGGFYVIEDARSADVEELARALGGTIIRGQKRDDDNLIVIGDRR